MIQNNKALIYIIALFSGLAGVLHATIVAFGHIAPLPLETLFFFGVGILQCILSILILRKDHIMHIYTLAILNGGVACVWLITRLFRAPFMNSPEEIGMLGLTVFLLEIGAILLTFIWKWRNRYHIEKLYRYSVASMFVSIVILSNLFGLSVYNCGLIGEMVMPNRTLTHGHGDEDEKPHEDNEKSENSDSKDEKSDHVDEVPHD